MSSRRRTLVSLREDVVRSGKGLRVDREKSIIHGVKVLGLESANGRRYLAEAVAKAAPMYEGRSVRLDHPKRPDDQRESEDVLGWLESVKVGEDGCLYGDLHLLASHPMTERVMEAAEKNPSLFGLSHNAQGDGEKDRDGVFVVSEIVEVRSVDLVADPATTNGLFESKGAKVKLKLKAFFESFKWNKLVKPKPKLGKKLGKRLVEMMDGYEDELEMPADDAGPQDHEQALKDGFRAAVLAVFDDDSMDKAAKLVKLREILTAEEKLSADDTEEGEDEPDGDEDVEEGCDGEDKMKESKQLRKRLSDLEVKESVRDLCESLSFQPSKVQLSALCALSSEKDRKALIEELKSQAPRGNAPRTRNVSEGRNTSSSSPGSTKDIKDGKGFAAALREGRFSGN